MYKKMEDAIKILAEQSKGANASDALKLTQAALNLAHVIATLKAAEQITPPITDPLQTPSYEETNTEGKKFYDDFGKERQTDPKLRTYDNPYGFVDGDTGSA